MLLLGSLPLSVVAEPPIAIVEPDNQTVCVGEEAFFYGNKSYDPDGGMIILYYWDFGDGIAGPVEENASHIYWVAGIYSVTLTVEDEGNEWGDHTISITVLDNLPSPEPPIAIAEPDNQTVYAGEEAWFNGSLSYDPDGFIVSYNWDFGDGNFSSGVNASHIYNVTGNYTVKLTVTDDSAAKGNDTINVTVLEPLPENQPPFADADPDYQTVYAGEEAWFNGSLSYDPDGFIVSYNWNFGDGNFSSGVNASHVYHVAGNYTIELTVTDDSAAKGNDTINVTVLEPLPENQLPFADAEPDHQTVYAGEEVWFNGSLSYDPDGFIISYDWDFGDGNSSSGVNISHIYNVPGQYNVTLTATDNNGSMSQDIVIVIVRESGPESSDESETEPSMEDTGSERPFEIMIVGILVILTIITLTFGTEVGKHKFLLFILPLYTKLSKSEILDNFTRGKIYGYILANPGDHYNSIKEALNISNGSFAYHVRVLEKERFIRSRRDGIYKRFYPYEMKIPSDVGELKESQKLIIEEIKRTPGISQREIAASMGISSATVNYHINKLLEIGFVTSIRKGMRKKYYLVDGP